jgi:hypothetical protein
MQQIADVDPRVEQRNHLLGGYADLPTEAHKLLDSFFQKENLWLLLGVVPVVAGHPLSDLVLAVGGAITMTVLLEMLTPESR